MKNKSLIVLIQVSLGVGIVSLFCLSLSNEIFMNPVRLLVSLLFFSMAYSYKKVLKDNFRTYSYILFGIILLIAFMAGVLNG